MDNFSLFANEQFHFEKLYNLSNDLICVASTDGFFKRVNPAVVKILGWDEEYLLSTSFHELLHPDDSAAAAKQLENFAQGIPAENLIIRTKCKDGSYKSIQWVTTPEPDSGFLFAIGRDITREKESEALLHSSENRFRSFFENSQGLMCTHDLTGKLLMVNFAVASSLGYSPDELIGLNLTEIIIPEYRNNLAGYMQELTQKGKATGLMHSQHRDGSTLIWLFNNVLEEDALGKQYVIGNAVDITKRHKLEKDLERTQQMLEETNKVARIGAWEMDVIRQKTYWSSVTKEIHCVPEDYQPKMEQSIEFYNDQNKGIVLAAVNMAIDQGKPFDLEVELTTATGKIIWVRSIGTAEFEDGVCTKLYGTFQDIDDKKKVEQELINEKLRLTAFVEHSPAAVVMMDTNLRYVSVSKRWIDDYMIQGDVLGKSQYEIFPDLDQDWRNVCERCLQGQSDKGDEVSWRPEGFDHDLYLRWEMLPWYKFDGTIGGIMIFTQDITESCSQREELEKAKLHAEQASVAKSEFLANMSHEIRTPLNGVIGFTDLVLKTTLNSTQHQYLSIVNQSANALLSIINDILDFSKIEAGKLELDIDWCDLFETSSQAADIITFQIQNKGLEMLLNIPNGLPRFIQADSLRLKQILVNLLGNAVKFTEQGEIELKVSPLTELIDGQMTLRFEVRDTGIGIQREMQGKIFEAFSQEDASTTKRYGGTGLGLTISNKLLGLMGSKLQLESSPGKGSTFFFDISLNTEAGEPIQWKETVDIHKALIVDDNDNNRLILREMLKLKNIEVHEASNGFEALQLLARRNQYDVILMDYHMPYMDGLETIRMIRESFIASPELLPLVLLHSSSDDERIQQACEELCINQRLVKPVKMEDLFNGLYHLNRVSVACDPNTKVPDEPFRIESPAISILVVEDNMVNKLLAKTIISRIAPHAQLLEASNGEEALLLYQKADLVLMDIQMPVMNGYEATKTIRALETDRRVPIIALTAGNVKGEKEKCLAAGMDDFVAKPFVEESIIYLLKVWLTPLLLNDGQRSTKVETPTESRFDLEVIKNYVGDDENIIKEVLVATLQELQGSMESIRLYAIHLDVKGLNSSGHKLYGTAVSAGLKNLAGLAKQLEQLEGDATHFPDLLKRTEGEIVIAQRLINHHLAAKLTEVSEYFNLPLFNKEPTK